MYSARVQIYEILRMSTQCVAVREGVHCGVTMETLPDRVPLQPVENYFLLVIKIVASQSDFSNLFRPLEGQRNQLEIEAEHCRRTKL